MFTVEEFLYKGRRERRRLSRKCTVRLPVQGCCPLFLWCPNMVSRIPESHVEPLPSLCCSPHQQGGRRHVLGGRRGARPPHRAGRQDPGVPGGGEGLQEGLRVGEGGLVGRRHPALQVGQITVDSLYGGQRMSLVTETSVLDPDEGIRCLVLSFKLIRAASREFGFTPF